MCHGTDLQGISGPPLSQSSIAHFGDAKSLLDFVSAQMPLTSPGSLSTQQYDAITAYILYRDGLLPPNTTVTGQNASSISLTATPTPSSLLDSWRGIVHYVPDLRDSVAKVHDPGFLSMGNPPGQQVKARQECDL